MLNSRREIQNHHLAGREEIQHLQEHCCHKVYFDALVDAKTAAAREKVYKERKLVEAMYYISESLAIDPYDKASSVI